VCAWEVVQPVLFSLDLSHKTRILVCVTVKHVKSSLFLSKTGVKIVTQCKEVVEISSKRKLNGFVHIKS
jgi:hypothetical protein